MDYKVKTRVAKSGAVEVGAPVLVRHETFCLGNGTSDREEEFFAHESHVASPDIDGKGCMILGPVRGFIGKDTLSPTSLPELSPLRFA